jgi:hypothetical protein
VDVRVIKERAHLPSWGNRGHWWPSMAITGNV